jgi:hypothetical protein
VLAQILLDPVVVDQRVVDVEEEDHIVHLLLISMLEGQITICRFPCLLGNSFGRRALLRSEPGCARRDLCKPLRAFARWRASMLVWTCRAKTARLS